MTDTSQTAEDVWRWLASCLTCGEPHQYREVCDKGHRLEECCTRIPTWAAPDGHPYRPRMAGASQLADLRAQWDIEAGTA